jgi:hypothetical protein
VNPDQYSQQRNTAQYQGTEITIHYPHHPYTGKQATVIGWNRFGDEVYFVLARPNASPFQVPIWMTKPEAAAMTVRTLPRIDVAALRDLRRLLDATRSSSDARSATDRKDDDEKDANASAKPIRCADGSSQDGLASKRPDGAAQAAGAGAAHRLHRRTAGSSRKG